MRRIGCRMPSTLEMLRNPPWILKLSHPLWSVWYEVVSTPTTLFSVLMILLLTLPGFCVTPSCPIAAPELSVRG
ncbi:hypothetical protein D3C87_2107650 [compost metagenome]